MCYSSFCEKIGIGYKNIPWFAPLEDEEIGTRFLDMTEKNQDLPITQWDLQSRIALRWELLVTRHGVPLGGDVIILVPERPEPWPHIRHNAKFKSALNSIPLYDPSPLSPVLYIQKKGYRLAKDPSWFCEGGPKGFFFFRKKTPPYPKLIIKIIISSSNTKFLMISKDLTNKKRGTLKNPEKKETRKMKKRTKS